MIIKYTVFIITDYIFFVSNWLVLDERVPKNLVYSKYDNFGQNLNFFSLITIFKFKIFASALINQKGN